MTEATVERVRVESYRVSVRTEMGHVSTSLGQSVVESAVLTKAKVVLVENYPKTIINLGQVNCGHVLRRDLTGYNLAQAICEHSFFDVMCNYSGLLIFSLPYHDKIYCHSMPVI